MKHRLANTAQQQCVMTSSTEWEESLDNIDELISSVGDLETEDVIYLEEYLVDEGNLDKSPGLWVALRESNDGEEPLSVRTEQEEDAHRNSSQQQVEVEEENLKNVDDPEPVPGTPSKSDTENTSFGSRQPRSTKGVTKPKFVTYQAFPPTKDKPFACEICGCRLASKESRKRHILAKHIKERNNSCSICGKSFVFRFSLNAHKAVHSPTPSFTCVCGQTFSVRASYMSHIRRVHRAASDVKFPCNICSKSFADHHTLGIHLISVHKPKTIACLHSGCNKLFSTGALMKSHYWYHLKKRFQCDECGKTFSTESYMYKHRRTHSGIRPYACVDCGKTYMSVSHLNKHCRAAHSSYRPFQCSFCGKCYKTKDQLTFHESSHRGEKPYRCDVCGYATAYRNTYYVHRKKHRTQSSTSNILKKDQNNSSNNNTSTNGQKIHSSTGDIKDEGKLSRDKLSLPKHKTVQGVASGKTHLTLHSAAPHVLKLGSASGRIKTHMTPTTTPVNVICVVSSKPNSSTSVFSEANTNIAGSIHVQPDSQGKNMQSTVNYIPATSTLVIPQESNTGVANNSSQQNGKPKSFELLTSDVVDGTSLKIYEGQESCIIISDTGKCAFPMCDSNDDSLLLFKLDDNSCVALCTHHALTDNLSETVKEGLSTVNLSTDILGNFNHQEIFEPKNGSDTVHSEASSCLALREVATETKLSSQEHSAQSRISSGGADEEQSSDSSPLMQLVPHSTITTEICVTSAPTQQTDSVKSSSEVSLVEHFPAVMELDSGMAGLSGPIVDESFSLAQMEVHCPLCEEQFLCMDDYITHLENSHN